MKSLSDYNLKIYYLVRGESTGGRGMSNFWPVGDGGGVPIQPRPNKIVPHLPGGKISCLAIKYFYKKLHLRCLTGL